MCTAVTMTSDTPSSVAALSSMYWCFIPAPGAGLSADANRGGRLLEMSSAKLSLSRWRARRPRLNARLAHGGHGFGSPDRPADHPLAQVAEKWQHTIGIFKK